MTNMRPDAPSRSAVSRLLSEPPRPHQPDSSTGTSRILVARYTGHPPYESANAHARGHIWHAYK